MIEPEHKACLCGCTDLVKIGEAEEDQETVRGTVSPTMAERLDIVPARFQVIRCPAAHVYMRERGDDPPQICLPPL